MTNDSQADRQHPAGHSDLFEPLDAGNWLAAIVESSDDAIISKSLDGRITSWNAGAERIFGYAAGEIVGKPITVLIPPELWHEESEILAHVRKGRRIDHYETTRLRKDGVRISVSLSISPIRAANGTITGISKIARDVTEGRRLRESEQAAKAETLAERRFHELIESAPDAILQVDSNGSILIANRTAETLFGYSRAELAGASVDMLLPESSRHGHAQHRRAFVAAGVTRPMGQGLDLLACRKDGTAFPVEISLSPVAGESGTNVIAVVRDVTERKLAEQQIRSLQQSYMLELEARQKEADRLNLLKSEFMASVSHELRTPLHTIIGFADLLAEEAQGPLNDPQRRFLHHIRTDSEHLLSLINDVLDLSRIEAGGLYLHAEGLSLRSVVSGVVEAIRPAAARKSVGVHINHLPDVKVLADPLRLRQVLYNLLSNGVKFTESGGQVSVHGELDGGFVQITVSDTGIGIPTDECGRIFEKFYQVGYTTDGVRKGTGLGLAISRRLVEMQGGKIWVDSRPGEGSHFHFTMPVDEHV